MDSNQCREAYKVGLTFTRICFLKTFSNQHTETEIKWQPIVVSLGRGNKDGNLRRLNGWNWTGGILERTAPLSHRRNFKIWVTIPHVLGYPLRWLILCVSLAKPHNTDIWSNASLDTVVKIF